MLAALAALMTGARFESDCGDSSRASGFCDATVWARFSCSTMEASSLAACTSTLTPYLAASLFTPAATSCQNSLINVLVT